MSTNHYSTYRVLPIPRNFYLFCIFSRSLEWAAFPVFTTYGPTSTRSWYQLVAQNHCPKFKTRRHKDSKTGSACVFRRWGRETRTLLSLLERAIYGPLKFKTFTEITFKVLTAVAKTSTIFWDITPWFSVKINRRFWKIFCLNYHNRRLSQRINKSETGGFKFMSQKIQYSTRKSCLDWMDKNALTIPVLIRRYLHCTCWNSSRLVSVSKFPKLSMLYFLHDERRQNCPCA
jgi:hypothetical protein